MVFTSNGEMQMAFVLLLLGQNFCGLEQWKRIVYLVCGSEEAMEELGDTLYVEFLRVLRAQLQECPIDFFYDLLSKDNFISVLLESLRKFLLKRFDWDVRFELPLVDDDVDALEEGEDAPVIVEL
ncbi:AAR2 protein-domain-containing protein [Thamnocephalis sphaerospora]|uniref:AAR2 protein-domain-containing protein n=1 Tax=Thamnocephalis sphaerospora TaxID=78915 RepID=A0A4P9XM87_9FUNG|nr:AAR2 protein-domain-containing protein [Thamnocephalis sphaerospora]|eukprot:RKP06985.1 AAR2 protein-domain-containing protein [Thamnocephalis sphaerospora]